MNIEFDQEPAGREPENKGGNTRILLLVLLLLVAVFGYLYYFTGFIKPREEATSPEPVQTAQVKQPIPPRPEGEPAGEGAKDGEKPDPSAVEAPKTEVAKPEPPKPEVKKPEPTKAEAKKAEAPKEPARKVEPAKVAAKNSDAATAKTTKPAPVPQTVAKAAPAKHATAPAADKAKADAAKKPVPAGKPAAGTGTKPAAGNTVAKADGEAAVKKKTASAQSVKPAAKKEKPKTATPAKSTAIAANVPATGPYTLRIGEYVVPSAMDKDKEKVRSAGFVPVVKEGSKKKEPMVRLLLAEAGDQESARRELARLRDATVEGFILNEGGTYRVYAGSYFVAERAQREQARLASQGIKVTIRKAAVSVPTFLLNAGKFETKDEALKAAASLRKAGLKPAIAGAGQ